MNVKVSLDHQAYKRKPNQSDISKLSNRIAASSCSVDVGELACKVGQEGHTFCPAIFKEGKRKADNFTEMQIFALDFDSGVRFEEIESRAERYHLPIAFAYHTFSSAADCPKFRVLFLNDVPVDHKHAAEIMIKMLMRIFREADGSCKDVSRMFYGGKGLIGAVKQECINIVNLTESFQRYLFETRQKNYTRDMEQFAKENRIDCINQCLRIFCVHEIGRFEDFSVSDQYIYGSGTVFPSNCPQYFIIEKDYQIDVRRKSQITYESLRTDFKLVERNCQLYEDFIELPYIGHGERFLLLTNMLHMAGGKKRFLSVIDKKDYDKNEWRFYAKYIKDKGYKPQSCDGNCPYADQCNHAVNMVNTVKQKEHIVKTGAEPQYDSVDEIYHYIETCLLEAVYSPTEGIYLIPAQTAAGKTEAYCERIGREKEHPFLIALPTNGLKQEVGERLKRKGVDAEVTLSLDEMSLERGLESKIDFYYRIGLGEKVIRLLRDYIKENEKSDNPDVKDTVNQCKRYVRQNNILTGSRVIVTTHARLLTLPLDQIRQYTVIIDEDILSTMFKNIRTVSMQTVHDVFDSDRCPMVLKERLGQIIKTPDGEYGKFEKASYFEGLSEQELEELEVYDDVNELSLASVFQREGDYVHYFIPQTLKAGKYIVLSATLDGGLYRRYFAGKFVKEYPYHRARYQGNLKQLSAYSMSRQCIQDHRKALEVFLKRFQLSYKIITFMKYEDEFGSAELHFGNAEGVDRLNGENVMIVGTPHLNEFVYKLIGFHMGMEVEDEVLAVRRIRYKEYEFSFMTYRNEELRNLQMFFIGKELEQCIGRARLLRNHCTVLVLSNFPCEQAEFIQDDYLKETEESGMNGACSPDMAGE